jgi:hypothetical protein
MPAPLADAGDRDGGAAHLHLALKALATVSVVMMPSAARAQWAALRIGDGGGQAGLDAVHRQRLHDDAGGERQHLRRVDVQLARQRRAGGARARQAIGAGAGVGVAGVDHHGADGLAARQMLAAHLHRRRAEAVLRKHARHRAAFVQQEHREVLAVGLAHAGFGTPMRTPATGCRSARDWERRDERAWGFLPKTGPMIRSHRAAEMKTRAEARVWCASRLKPACRGTACIFSRCRRGRDRCGPPGHRRPPSAAR